MLWDILKVFCAGYCYICDLLVFSHKLIKWFELHATYIFLTYTKLEGVFVYVCFYLLVSI